MSSFVDQCCRTVFLHEPAKKIVSLVPSQTEFLYSLGLETEVIGITKFCRHPLQWYTEKRKVGGTKTINTKTIHALKPDLVIANKEENTKEAIEELEKYFPVWISDVNNFEDACDMMMTLGQLTGKQEKAVSIVNKIQDLFSALKMHAPPTILTAAYLIWRNPFMAAAGGTFINSMLNYAGFRNVFEDWRRYPEVNLDTILEKKVDIVLLSTEPYPFKHTDVEEINLLLQGIKVILVDGEMFSWYGSRLLLAPSYFEDLQKSLQYE